MFGSSSKVRYQHAVEGTWGEFTTPAGTVAFLMTKARLGAGGIDSERRLTAQLRPVREVLDIKSLDFNQLLQRDLDDHRVATMLIPYLLSPKPTGPAFFPPILAAILPFDGSTPMESYDRPDTPRLVKEEGGIAFLETSFGTGFRVQQLADEAGNPHQIKLGRLAWNEEKAKLVVIDGQHRAMALIAIDRTVNKMWDRESGTRYRHFYEHRVNELMATGNKDALAKIEIPVTICWFPALGTDGSAQRSARKLFVDVNKEARTPSEARLILLSDTELRNIFTRSLLNRLRQDRPPFPLFSIEYDNPETDVTRPARWSVLTNLNLLKIAVTLCVFGPEKYISNVDARFTGRLPEDKMNQYMRERLDIRSLLPSQIQDGERVIDRDLVGNDHFPMSHVDKLVDRFMNSWGSVILAIFGQLAPYEAHNRALERLYEGWITDDALASLARDALFEGMGMFWTLRDGFFAWDEAKKSAREKKLAPAKPDTAKAWELIESKRKDFEGERAVQYLGKATKKDVDASSEFFKVANTQACQLGAVLAFASLAHKQGCTWNTVEAFAESVVAAWNAALTEVAPVGRDRKMLFAREGRHPINRVGRLDTTLAVYFRYFWLELLRAQAAKDTMVPGGAAEGLDSLCSTARKFYLDYLVEEQAKTLKRTNPTWKQDKLNKKALEVESKALASALKDWFGMSQADFDAWLASAPTANAEREQEAEAAPPGMSEGVLGRSEKESEEPSLSDVVAGLPDDEE